MIEVPEAPILDEYITLVKDKGRGDDGSGVLDRRLLRAEQLLAEPGELASLFNESVDRLREFFTDPANVPASRRFYGTRTPLADSDHRPDVTSTASVGAMFEANPDQLWPVLGESALSFYYLDRELAVTHAEGMRLDSDRLELLRTDLLLASQDGTPIVAELKVTEPNHKVDKDPFFALIQVLAAVAYLSPKSQVERLREHDHHDPSRLETRIERLDAYIILAREPAASDVWFELRDRADRLARATSPLIGSTVRTLAAIDLDWLNTPSGERRKQPRLVKRFAYQATADS